MERHYRYTWHRRAWSGMRRYVQLDLGNSRRSADDDVDVDITLDDARHLVARGVLVSTTGLRWSRSPNRWIRWGQSPKAIQLGTVPIRACGEARASDRSISPGDLAADSARARLGRDPRPSRFTARRTSLGRRADDRRHPRRRRADRDDHRARPQRLAGAHRTMASDILARLPRVAAARSERHGDHRSRPRASACSCRRWSRSRCR